MATMMNRKVTILLLALDMLLCLWIRYFTIFVAAWWLKQAANSTKDKERNLRKVNSQASEDI